MARVLIEFEEDISDEEEISDEELSDEEEISLSDLVFEILVEDFLNEYSLASENILYEETDFDDIDFDIFHAIISHSYMMTSEYILERLQEEFEMNDLDAELEIVTQDIQPGQVLPWDNNKLVSFNAEKCFHLSIKIYFD